MYTLFGKPTNLSEFVDIARRNGEKNVEILVYRVSTGDNYDPTHRYDAYAKTGKTKMRFHKGEETDMFSNAFDHLQRIEHPLDACNRRVNVFARYLEKKDFKVKINGKDVKPFFKETEESLSKRDWRAETILEHI